MNQNHVGRTDQMEGGCCGAMVPLTLQPEESGRVGSIPGWAPPLERHDKRLVLARLALSYIAIPALGAKKRNFTFIFTFNPQEVDWREKLLFFTTGNIEFLKFYILVSDILPRVPEPQKLK